MNSSIDETILQQTVQVQNDYLKQQWHPCSKGLILEKYFLMEQNGPFLRALCQTWQNLGSPKLEIVERMKSVYPFSKGGQLLSNGLLVLANSQEETIWKLVQEFLRPNQAINILRTFEAFASQLNLFSMVKSELIQIERKRNGENHLHFYQVFQRVWQSHLELFDQGRNFCNKQTLHLCIGNLIWGDSFGVSLEMLKYSFQGYLIQENKKFESVRKFSLPHSSSKYLESCNSQTKFQKFENSMKRRDAYTPVLKSENALPSMISEEIIRPSSPEEMIEDIDKDGEKNFTDKSPIKWRKRLWTLTLTTPNRTYSIEISPKGTTALSRTDGIVFPIQPVQFFNKESESCQLGTYNEVEEVSQQIIQQVLAQLPELEYVFPCGTVAQISQKSTGE